MLFGDEANMFLKDDKKPNIPLRQHYSHQEKKYQNLNILRLMAKIIYFRRGRNHIKK